MKRLICFLSITTFAFISSCSTNVLSVDRIPIGYFVFEFINDTEYVCQMSWEDDTFDSPLPKTLQIKPGDTSIQIQAVNGSSSSSHFLIETRPFTIVFSGEQDYLFSLDENFSWTTLPHTEKLTNLPDEHNTTYRFYLSDILSLDQAQ